jgi:hypothetical protein
MLAPDAAAALILDSVARVRTPPSNRTVRARQKRRRPTTAAHHTDRAET